MSNVPALDQPINGVKDDPDIRLLLIGLALVELLDFSLQSRDEIP